MKRKDRRLIQNDAVTKAADRANLVLHEYGLAVKEVMPITESAKDAYVKFGGKIYEKKTLDQLSPDALAELTKKAVE